MRQHLYGKAVSSSEWEGLMGMHVGGEVMTNIC